MTDDWLPWLTDGEERRLRAGLLPAARRAYIAREVARDMRAAELDAPTPETILAGMTALREAVVAQQWQETCALIAEVAAMATPVQEAAPKAAKVYVFNEVAAKIINSAVRSVNKGRGEMSVCWAATCALFIARRERIAAGHSKRSWKGLGIDPNALRKRWVDSCKSKYFEAIAAVLPSLPVSSAEREKLEALCSAGIFEGERLRAL
jgi:hypothetical protein